MARQNTRTTKVRAHTPLSTSPAVDTRTYEGAPAFTKSTLTDLFTLATTDFGGEATFYETGDTRRDRYRDLIHAATATDPGWVADMLPWLRNAANMRANPLIGAIEFGRALDALACDYIPHPDDVDRGRRHIDGVRYVGPAGELRCVNHAVPGSRRLSPRGTLGETLRRADEPGEAVAYWTAHYGRKMPMWFKRGVGDAAIALWTERAVLKYDSDSAAWRMGDVLELCHPNDANAGAQRMRPYQADLFAWLLADRHNRDEAKTPPETLPMIRARAELMALSVADRRAVLRTPEWLSEAGMTWESLAGWLQGPMDREAWEAIIPTMGIMAITRNLRNFDQAGVSDDVAATVALRLMNADEISRSRMFPFRFLSAYLAAPSDRWRHPLGVALRHSALNVPAFPGRTLVAIDVSGSMSATLSEKSSVERWKVGALFAAVVAHRNGHGAVDVVAFATNSAKVDITHGGSILRDVETFGSVFRKNYEDGWGGKIGHGTNTAAAVQRHYAGHDRVIVMTDDQSRDGDPGSVIPANVDLFTFDLAGYDRASTATAPHRHLTSGFSDKGWDLIARADRGLDSGWPWEQK